MDAKELIKILSKYDETKKVVIMKNNENEDITYAEEITAVKQITLECDDFEYREEPTIVLLIEPHQSKQSVPSDLSTIRDKALEIDFELLNFNKFKGEYIAGSRVFIKWNNVDYIDEGYIFTTPECALDEGDCFVHIPTPEDPYGKDTAPEVFVHMYDLLSNNLIDSIKQQLKQER